MVIEPRTVKSPLGVARIIKPLVTFIVSPTRFVIEVAIERSPYSKRRLIFFWNRLFVAIVMLTIAVVAYKPAVRSAVPHWVIWLYIWLVPLSRCNELLMAHLIDALAFLSDGRGPGSLKRTEAGKRNDEGDRIRSGERVYLVLRGYLEVLFQFAIVYFLWPNWFDKGKMSSVVDAIYFSGITITTTGFGDILPTTPVSKMLALYEVLTGIILVVLTFTVYVSQALAQQGEKSKKMDQGDSR